jgi:hypothetical protein
VDWTCSQRREIRTPYRIWRKYSSKAVTCKVEKEMCDIKLERILDKWCNSVKLGYDSVKARGNINTGRDSIIGSFLLHHDGQNDLRGKVQILEYMKHFLHFTFIVNALPSPTHGNSGACLHIGTNIGNLLTVCRPVESVLVTLSTHLAYCWCQFHVGCVERQINN